MARPTYPSDQVDKTMVRFPEGMMDRLRTAASRKHRSMNAEIISRLEDSFTYPEEIAELTAEMKTQAAIFHGITDHLMDTILELSGNRSEAALHLADSIKKLWDSPEFQERVAKHKER